ncbi:hypothetical protein [Arcobacter sp.]|uniref:hypothetical protein n=1 Tax=Arcobacter sp. TaxID=1872629 RepID=UPI003C7861D9
MTNIITFSNSQEQIHRWGKKLPDYNINILLPITESFTYEGVIAIVDETSYKKDIDKIINQLKKQKIRILLLEENPTFEKAKEFIKSGICGYGNLELNSKQLNDAIKVIRDDLTWLAPEFKTELFSDINQKEILQHKRIDNKCKNIIILSDEIISIMKI